MLDLVDPEVVAPLLGDLLDFQLVDRVSLTSFQIEAHPAGRNAVPAAQEHERPVALARVMLPRGEQARHTIDGWPMWFTRPIGRGKIIFTTLGPRGWYRARIAGDPRSPYDRYPDLPVATPPLQILAEHLQPPPEEDQFQAERFRETLIAEIGYSVLGRREVVLVFGGVLLASSLLGLVLIKARRTELIGWLVPIAAIGVGIMFVLSGEGRRRAVEPTMAVAQIVEAVEGKEEAAIHGLLAAYRPDSGPVTIGAERGGHFEIDTIGLEGQARRWIQTDLDAWHWENLALPAGVRFAPFRATAATGEPISAVARFGPEGLVGRLATGPFHELTDVLLATPEGRNLGVRLRDDGTFDAGGQDILLPGQFLADAVLSDAQQRRQELYRDFLKRPRTQRGEGRPFVLAWAKPIDMGFTLVPGGKMTGAALLVIPIQLERCESGSPVTIPGPLVSWRRVIPGGLGRPLRELSAAVDQQLRFQLPFSALPLRIDRARLAAKIDAPSRRVTISGQAQGGPVEVFHADSPLDVVRVDITDERLLRLDENGGLHLNLTIGDSPSDNSRPEKWHIEFVELEINGRAE
jgi:hypothetical protein